MIFDKSEEPFEKQQKQNLDSKLYECPRCNHIFKIENIDIKIMEFDCPICGQKNIFQFPLEQSEKKYGESHYISWLFQLNTNATIIGLLIIFTSIAILFRPNPFNIKLSITFLIIGIIFPMFLIEKNNISVKITFGTVLFIILLSLATGTDLEIFLNLIFLGLFITKIVIDNYLPSPLKIRMNIFLSAFFIIFITLVIKRIINTIRI
jgi:DNA-directed RNA polymerase subunit RPC12/RpoP